MITNITLSGVIAFLLAVIISPFAIPFLKKLKFGQTIRDIGPSWHKSKNGTPTMGGIIFILALIIPMLIFHKSLDTRTWLVFFCSFGFGLVGFIDDFIKVILKRNLGLKSLQKLFLQIVVSVLFIIIALNMGFISTKICIPFTSSSVSLGWFYIPVALFIILGTVNSVNLTDGIDGLATTVTIFVMLFYCIIFNDNKPVSIYSFSLICALIGFLLFNKHPAKVFMGDTGSLFLGGAVASLAFIADNPLILVLIGIVYFCEALSVIIQVTSFKLTGKRVFKMSPIHHHFEMSGWSERKIVAIFSIVTIVFCIIALLAI